MSAAYPLVRKRSALSTRLGVFCSPSRSGSSPSSISKRFTRSCIASLYVALTASMVVSIPGLDALISAQVPADEADGFYKDREHLASAQKAAEIWAARLAKN